MTTTTNQPTAHRLWELDATRGVAFILMAFFHVVFFLVYLESISIPVTSGPIRWTGRVAAAIFIILVGLSAYLSYVRVEKKLSAEVITIKFMQRGALLFCCGLLVSVATLLIIPESTIIFGILHFIGASVMLSRFAVLLSKKWLVIIGSTLWVLGSWLSTLESPTSTWLVLGIKPENFSTLDYYPLLPWFGMVILGILLGKIWYINGKRQGLLATLSKYKPNWAVHTLQLIGQNALVLYLLHMPVFFAVIWLLRIWPT